MFGCIMFFISYNSEDPPNWEHGSNKLLEKANQFGNAWDT